MKTTDKSWEDWYEDWRQSMTQVETPAQSMDRPVTYACNYMYKIGNGTPRAQFFCIEKEGHVERGFWCPRSAVVSDTGSTVHIEHWCKVRVIEYNRVEL